MKRFCVVTILFILIVSAFIIPSFAVTPDSFLVLYDPRDSALGITYEEGLTYYNIDTRYGNIFKVDTDYEVYFFGLNNGYFYTVITPNTYNSLVSGDTVVAITSKGSSSGFPSTTYTKYTFGYDSTYDLYAKRTNYSVTLNNSSHVYCKMFDTYDNGMTALKDFIENPPSVYTKNPNVDEFIANTLISMGVKFNSYTSALPVAQSAWNYLIDEDNWYIGSGARNDKDIKWDIDSAVSYLNAQSNNYLDWYNGYKVSKDVTIALNKFIKDNYVASTLNNGTIAGESVYLNTQYMYASSGGSAPGSSFGSSPSAFSFYPASTVTYFNGEYLHDNNEIDLDEFIYAPADVRKFISYPSSEGIIVPPEDSTGTGVITDGNGDTVYNIDLDFPSLDWLADAIQAVLDFLNRLITTIADFLTQILDAILSLFSDAFESLTTFGQGIIEWLYSVIESLGTLGSNYIPSDLWAIILPFIYLNVGIAILMFVLRSH